jgi:hypothetical protein
MVSFVETVDLETTARRLVGRGKGILAADESLSTMKKRFDGVGLESTEDLRRAYRQMLFTTPDFERFISGVILFEESTGHKTDHGESFVDLLASKGILPGVKVGTGNKAIPGYPEEMYTEGLDGLQEALPEMRDRGIAFTKWRAVISVGEGRPSQFAIDTNAQSLARMAALSQQAGLVPIVEPEVLMEGTHGIDECRQATERTLRAVFTALPQHRVQLEGAPQDQHGASGEGVRGHVLAERSRRGHDRVLSGGAPTRTPRSGLPVRRSVRGRGDSEPQRHEHPWRSALGADVLIRPRAPRFSSQDLGGLERERGGGARTVPHESQEQR